MSWSPGETIVLRQVWQGKPLFAFPVVVISDEPGLLVTYREAERIRGDAVASAGR